MRIERYLAMITVLLCSLLIATVLNKYVPKQNEDVNKDGIVDLKDLLLVQKTLVKNGNDTREIYIILDEYNCWYDKGDD